MLKLVLIPTLFTAAPQLPLEAGRQRNSTLTRGDTVASNYSLHPYFLLLSVIFVHNSVTTDATNEYLEQVPQEMPLQR